MSEHDRGPRSDSFHRKLSKPLVHAERTVTEISLREPTVSEVEASLREDGLATVIVLMSLVSDGGITVHEIRKMGVGDFYAAKAFIDGFFPSATAGG